MPKLTTQERAAIEQRMADLKARMDKLDCSRNPESIQEWAKFYEERETLDNQLGDGP
jgi:hypothetical protein